MTAAAPKPPVGSVLRFAVAMRGGVSLAVWIGGALSEIDCIREPPTDAFATRLLAVTRFSRLEVDILTGASAGGLNAALGGLAIAKGARMNLRSVWIQVADIDKLLAPPTDGSRLKSLLNGEYFLAEVQERLRRIEAERKPAQSRPVELFLATTILGGVHVTDPTDRTVRDPRRGAYFHFRHHASAKAFSDLDAQAGVADRLGCAARSTASFPGAFEPVKVAVGQFGGRLLLPAADPPPTSLRVFDGGVLDNIPVARAIRAVATSPAQESVRRWVVFLHPSPSALGPAPSRSVPDDEPSMLQIVQDVVAGRGTETLLDDLEALRTHNRESESQRLQRYSLCEAAFVASDGGPAISLVTRAVRALCALGVEFLGCPAATGAALASVDADRLYALLEDPTTGSGWVPIGQDAMASPLAGLDPNARFGIRMGILESLVGRQDSVRPFARLVRLALFMVEWIRWQEMRSGVELGPERRRVYDVMLVSQMVDAALESAFLHGGDKRNDELSERLEEVTGWAALHTLLDDLDGVGAGGPLHPRDRLPDGSRETLDRIARGELPGAATTGTTGVPRVDDRLLDRLAQVGVELVSNATVQPGERSVFGLLTTRLGTSADVDRARAHLLLVDTACAGLHRGRAIGVPMTLEYYKISGAASSPLAAGGSDLGAALPNFEHIQSGAEGIAPNAKLSGNSLGNFSAFVSPRFRANDWMWGRMDAAAGVADILLRPTYLKEAPIGPLKAAILAPFTSVTNPTLKASGEAVSKALWDSNQAIVVDELAKPGTGANSLRHIRQLVTARWQLEIFLSEVEAMVEEPLQPGGRRLSLPSLKDVDANVAADRPVATSNVRKVMAAYEHSPRRVGKIWGQRKTTALGVKVARASAGALVPGAGVLNSLMRTVVAVPLMIITAATLARGGFLVAAAILLNVLLVPRLTAVVATVTLVASVLAARWLFRFASPDTGWWRRVTAGLTLAAFAVGIATRLVKGWRFSAPPAFSSKWPWDVPEGRGWGILGGMVAVGVLVAFASALLTSWAKPKWTVTVSVVAGAVIALWVPMGAWRHDSIDLSTVGRMLAPLGSMWVPAFVLVLLTTTITMGFRPEDR